MLIIVVIRVSHICRQSPVGAIRSVAGRELFTLVRVVNTPVIGLPFSYADCNRPRTDSSGITIIITIIMVKLLNLSPQYTLEVCYAVLNLSMYICGVRRGVDVTVKRR